MSRNRARRACGSQHNSEIDEVSLVRHLLMGGKMRKTTYLIAALLGCAACATLPQPAPVLGIPGKRMSFALTEGLPYAPTRATLSGPDTPPVTLKRSFEAYEGGTLVPLFEPRFSFAHRIGDRMYGSGHLGWWMSGVELRILPHGDQVDIPVAVTVGAQFDAPAKLLGVTDAAIWDVRAQLSVHPTFHGVQAMLGAGFSAGRQKHDLNLPKELAHPPDAGFAPPSLLRVLRREGRIEGVIGFSLARSSARFAFAVQPFYVVAQGAVSTLPCAYCKSLHVDSFDASWGAVFTLTLLASGP
jgi:hypothetical protein